MKQTIKDKAVERLSRNIKRELDLVRKLQYRNDLNDADINVLREASKGLVAAKSMIDDVWIRTSKEVVK